MWAGEVLESVNNFSEYSGRIRSISCCWWCGPLRHWDTRGHDIEYAGHLGPCQLRGMISELSGKSVLRRYRNYTKNCMLPEINSARLYMFIEINSARVELTHRGLVTHTCVSKLTILGSDNGLSPGRRQAIIWTTAGILLAEHLGQTSMNIQSKFIHFNSRKSIGKWWPFCLGLNMLMYKERPREMGIPSKLIRSALRARSVVSMYQSTPPSLIGWYCSRWLGIVQRRHF